MSEAQQWEEAWTWHRRGKPQIAAQGSPWYGKLLEIKKSELRRQDVLERQEVARAEEISVETAGRFKPIYSNGKLTGFEDIQTGMSVGIEEFRKEGGYEYEVEAPPEPTVDVFGIEKPKDIFKKKRVALPEYERLDLPYQRRGTAFFREGIFEAPPPAFVEAKGEPIPFAVFGAEVSRKITGVGGLLEYKPDVTPETFWKPSIAEAPPGMAGKGTAIFRKPTEKEVEAAMIQEAIPYTFLKGGVFGALAVTVPPVALTLAGFEAAEIAYKGEEYKRMITEYPSLTVAHLVAGIGGAALGGYATVKASTKLSGYVRTIGKQRVAAEALIDPRVLRGEKTFPTAPTKYHYQSFLKSKYRLAGEKKLGVWHATSEKFAKEFIIRAGKYRAGEPLGLYVSPSISPYFLRTGVRYKLFGLGMESILGKRPAVLRIYPRGIVRGIKGRIGYAELPLTKPEIQAVIPLTTLLKRVGAKYYVSYKHTRIPIYQFEVGKGAGITPSISLKTALSRYSYGKPTPLISPSIISKALTSISKVSYPPSYKISYKMKPTKYYKGIVSKVLLKPYIYKKRKYEILLKGYSYKKIDYPKISILYKERYKPTPPIPTVPIVPPEKLPPEFRIKRKKKKPYVHKKKKPISSLYYVAGMTSRMIKPPVKMTKPQLKEFAASPVKMAGVRPKIQIVAPRMKGGRK